MATTIADYTNPEEEIWEAAFAGLKIIDLHKRVRLIGVRGSNLQR